jgi:hypothetical protein
MFFPFIMRPGGYPSSTHWISWQKHINEGSISCHVTTAVVGALPELGLPWLRLHHVGPYSGASTLGCHVTLKIWA